MALASLKKRTMKAQEKTLDGDYCLGMVEAILRRGAFYDELTDEEKNAYCDYCRTDRNALEEVNALIYGSLHFQVERNPKPPTEAQFRERVREVAAIIKDCEDEYNATKGRAAP